MTCGACGNTTTYKGRGPKPKHCQSEQCRAARNRAKAAQWYAEHRNDPDRGPRIAIRRRAADKRWRERNTSYVKARLSQWRSGNREAMAEQYRRWRLANAEYVRAKNGRRRARLLDAFVADVDPQAIWERDGGICQLCDEPIDPLLRWPNPMSKTIDHIVPLATGGTHEPGNVQLAHALCNCIKGDRVAA